MDSLNILLHYARSRLGADSVVFYRYYPRLNQLVYIPIIVGNVYHPSTFGTIHGIPPDIQRVLSTRKIWYWTDASSETKRDFDYVTREDIRSYVGAPLIANDKTLGVLLINYRTSIEFSSSERQSIEQVISDITTAISETDSLYENDQAISRYLVRISLPLPPLLYIEQFFDQVSHVTYAVSYLYSLFTLLASNQTNIIRAFINELSDQKNLEENSTTLLFQYLTRINFEPLRISSIHYGSPVSIDLLGIGSALETLRETLKDLAWRGKHERQLAELERRNKQAEIASTRLEHEKTAVEIALQRTQIEKAKLENEKLFLDIATQKLMLLQTANGLQLSNDDKKLIVAVLLPKMEIIKKGFIAESELD